MRACLDSFAANERKPAGRLKGGGNAPILPLDFDTAEGELRSMDRRHGSRRLRGPSKLAAARDPVWLGVGLMLAHLVAAMPDPSGKHYYFKIMLPGSIVGAIVGFATQRYQAAKA